MEFWKLKNGVNPKKNQKFKPNNLSISDICLGKLTQEENATDQI